MSARTLLYAFLSLAVVAALIAAVREAPSPPANPSGPPGTTTAMRASPADLPNPKRPDRLVEGFKALAAEDFGKAFTLLGQPSASSAALEDLRLLAWAEAAAATENYEVAQQALRTLVYEHPGSPVRGLAILRAAQISTEVRQWSAALEWCDFALDGTVPSPIDSEIGVVVWKMGLELDRPELLTRAARRLLVRHPELADELEIWETLRQSLGLLELTELLNPEQLQSRARALIDERRAKEALETLDWVPENQRRFDWTLSKAEALTKNRQGRDALELLAGLDSSDPGHKIDILFQRALAAREASKVRRGRSNLPSSRREELAREAGLLLQRVANETEDKALQRRALEILFAQISDDDDSFEQAFTLLRRLKVLDPDDTTGTRYLFRLGWRAYVQRDYSRAIGYWSELESLYAGTNSARSGRYWTGRAHEAMGHAERASSIYAEILAAGAEDFYSRHARARLAEPKAAAIASPRQPTEPWPTDPLLARARWLSDLGLNELALHELEAYAGVADRRAYFAGKAELLARAGERRESIGWLVRAFPSLGRTTQNIVPREALELYYPLDFRDVVELRAEEQQLSPFLVFAMIRQESAFDASARSWAGARGLMQLMPATGREIAQRLGLRYSTTRLEDPDFSVRLGTRYFRQVLDMFDGNQELALAGYNGGPYRIKKLWRRAGHDPELDRFVEGLSLEETKTYVKRILLFEDTYHKLYTKGG